MGSNLKQDIIHGFSTREFAKAAASLNWEEQQKQKQNSEIPFSTIF